MNHLDPKQNYGAEPLRAPPVNADETLIHDECGRVLGNTCYRSHWFRVVCKNGFYTLRVKHGAGVDDVRLGYARHSIEAWAALDSDALYLLLHTIYRVHGNAANCSAEATAKTYRTAFVEGRLKKRKQRGSQRFKVWIEGFRMLPGELPGSVGA